MVTINATLTITGERVLKCLKGKGIKGALTSDIALDLDMMPRYVEYVLGRQLEPIGEVFRIEHRWVATDAVLSMKFNQKQAIERMKTELENALSDGWEELPERVRVLFKEFASGKNLPTPMTELEAFRFAQKRALKEGVV